LKVLKNQPFDDPSGIDKIEKAAALIYNLLGLNLDSSKSKGFWIFFIKKYIQDFKKLKLFQIDWFFWINNTMNLERDCWNILLACLILSQLQDLSNHPELNYLNTIL
jgi:hypothetical protein